MAFKLTPLGALLDRLADEFPEQGQIDLQVAARLITMVDADRQLVKDANAQPEIVRVMRVYVFEGERKVVEEQLARSLGDGTRILARRSGKGDTKIHVATIGSIPQILPMNVGYMGWEKNEGEPVAEPLGAHMVYVCRSTWAGNVQAEYDRALACGATAIMIPTDGGASNVYTLAGFRKTWGYTLKLELPKSAAPEAPPAEIPPPAPDTLEDEIL